jgi:uncharacterized membrane protein YjjB (DUF3815 family)
VQDLMDVDDVPVSSPLGFAKELHGILHELREQGATVYSAKRDRKFRGEDWGDKPPWELMVGYLVVVPADPIDLARTRIALGIARLTYAAVIVLLICAGLLFGFAAVGANLAIGGSSPPVPLVIDVIAAGCAVASFGTFFSMPWRLLVFPIAAGMLAHAARWALITVGGESAATGALVACTLVSVIVTPVVDRLHLPFAALAFSAVVSMIPGFFLFNAAAGLVELVSIGSGAPAALLTSIATNGLRHF